MNLDQVEIFETADEKKATKALRDNKIDVIITVIKYIHKNSKIRTLPSIKITDMPVTIKNNSSIQIPCRTLFFSPKLGESDRKEIANILMTYPWKNQNYNIKALVPINKIEYVKIQKYFNWNLDNKIRSKLKKL